MQNEPMLSDGTSTVREYLEAAKARDVFRLGTGFDKEVIWHQPGESSISGTYRSLGQLFDLFLRMDGLTNGTFRIDSVDEVMANDDLVTAIVHYSAAGIENGISMVGVDLFRIKDGKIVEVWPFSPDQSTENEFWDRLAATDSVSH